MYSRIKLLLRFETEDFSGTLERRCWSEKVWSGGEEREGGEIHLVEDLRERTNRFQYACPGKVQSMRVDNCVRNRCACICRIIMTDGRLPKASARWKRETWSFLTSTRDLVLGLQSEEMSTCRRTESAWLRSFARYTCPKYISRKLLEIE